MNRDASRTLLALLVSLAALAAPGARAGAPPQENLDHALQIAAKDGEAGTVVRLLADGADENSRNPRGKTPLMLAAGVGSLGAVRALLAAGADPEARDRRGQSVLDHAVAEDEECRPILRALVAAGSAVDGPTLAEGRGGTALTTAAIFECLAAAETLLELGASVDARGSDGCTPLMAAIHERREPGEAILRLLLAHGADVNARNRAGETPLLLALTLLGETPEEGWPSPPEVAQLLVAHGARMDVRDANGQTVLIRAAGCGDLTLVRRAIALRGRVNDVDQWGGNALTYADSEEVARLLLEHGAEVNRRGRKGRTALAHWVEMREMELVRRLLELGAWVDARDDEGRTPLMGALDAKGDLVEALLSAGADPNAADRRGETVLMHLCRGYCHDSLPLLLARGTRVRARDVDGIDALMSMLDGRLDRVRSLPGIPIEDSEGLRLLLRAGAQLRGRAADGRTPLMIAVHQGLLRSAAVLLAMGANPNDRDRQGRTALMWAAEQRRSPVPQLVPQGEWKRMVELLVRHGARVDARDCGGATALQIAAQGFAKEEVLEGLLGAGADPDLADTRGITPLAWAAMRGGETTVRMLQERGARLGLVEAILLGDPERAMALLRAGASPNVWGPAGRTVLVLAAERGYADLVEALLDRGARTGARQIAGLTPLQAAVGAWIGTDYWWQPAPSSHLGGPGGQEWPLAPGQRLRMVRVLLRRGARVNARNDFRETALMWAAHSGLEACVRELLAAGAAVHFRARYGGTALELADDRDHWEIVKLLRHAGGVARMHRPAESRYHPGVSLIPG